MLEAGSAVFSVFSFAAAAVEVVNSAADFAVDFESGLRCLVGCLFSPQTLISSNCRPLLPPLPMLLFVCFTSI